MKTSIKENSRAFPQKIEVKANGGIEERYELGLTIRDYFAAKENGFNLTEGITIKSAEEIMGFKIPQNNIENRMYWYELEAKLQYMKADAMLKERSK